MSVIICRIEVETGDERTNNLLIGDLTLKLKELEMKKGVEVDIDIQY